MGILLVYDVTDENSFSNVRNWMRQIDQNAAANVNRVLIGNKCDCDASERKVKVEQGKALADEFGLKIFETSAKLNINVDKAFVSIATDIVERLKVNPDHYGSEGGMNLNKDKGKANPAGSKGCC
jgi:Ras-related protein Rab-8A